MTSKVMKVGKYTINIVTDNESALAEGLLTENDIEMDIRANAAVQAAIEKAIVCKKPIARYDIETGRAYLEYANGEREYVN